MPQGHGEAARPVPKISTSCELFLKGICKDGNLCHYTHNPSDVTRFEMCAEFWISGWCANIRHCSRAHVVSTGKVLSNRASRGLTGLASGDGGTTSTPPVKRTRERPNERNISKATWDYVDWAIRKFEEEGYDWEVWMNGQFVNPRKVRKRTNEEVSPILQSLRKRALTRPPAPRQPHGCSVLKKLKTPSAPPGPQKEPTSATTDPTSFTISPGRSDDSLPELMDTESISDDDQDDDLLWKWDGQSYSQGPRKVLQCEPDVEQHKKLVVDQKYRTESGNSEKSNASTLSWNPRDPLFRSEHAPLNELRELLFNSGARLLV